MFDRTVPDVNIMESTSEHPLTKCNRSAASELHVPSTSRKLYYGLCLVALVYALLAGLRTVTDWDLGWQLATGRWVVQHHQIPSTDVFSYTAYGRPWVYPVGSGIIFYLVYRIGQYALLSWLGAAACVGTVALLLRRGSAVTAVLAILAVPRIALRSTPRAEIFTMVLLAAFLSLLWQYYETGRARLWLLPLLMVFWVNLHPGFVVGVAVIAGYLLMEALDLLWSDRRQAALDRLAGSWPWLAAALVATLANPWGWKIYSWAIGFSAPLTLKSQWIGEWSAPQLTSRSVLHGLSLTGPDSLVVLLLVVAMTIPVALLQRRLGAAALLAGAAFFGLRHIRLEALFSVMVVVIAGAVLSSTLRPQGTKLNQRLGSILAVGTCSLLVILVCTWSRGLVTDRTYLGGTDIASFGTGLGWWFPEGAAAFIERENIPGQIFNSYSEGGFIAWRLGPKYRDYIDGRGAPFGTTLVTRSTDLVGSMPDSPEWQLEVERYDINAIIVPLGRYQALAQFPLVQFCSSASWQPVYLDETSAVFVRRRPETKSLIQRLKIDCSTTPLPLVAPKGQDGSAFNQWANAAAMLKALGRNAEAYEAAGKALSIFPDSAFMHYTQASLLDHAGDLRSAEAQYLTAAALAPANGASWAALAQIYDQEGRLSDAIHAWEQLTDILPAPYLELVSLGYDDLAANRPQDALRAFDRSSRCTPATVTDASLRANVAHGRAMAWKSLGDFAQAISYEEQTLRLTPDRAEDWHELARLYELTGRGEDAQRARQRAAMLSDGTDSNSR